MNPRNLKIPITYLYCLFLAACSESGQSQLNQAKPTGSTSFTTTLTSPNLPVLSSSGTISGGGGFADTYALEMLAIAKNSLGDMIENASPKLFSNLPEDKGQQWLANLIRKIEYRPEECLNPEKCIRYNRPLKFDYNLDEQTIIATKYFSSTFPYGRIWTRSASERLRILFEVYLDIMHEVAHFYDIGITEQTDKDAEMWAYKFIFTHLGAEKYICTLKIKNDGLETGPEVDNKKNIVLFFSPTTGFAVSGHTDDINSETFYKYNSEDNVSLISLPEESDDKHILDDQFWTFIGLANKKEKLNLPTIDVESLSYLKVGSLNIQDFNRPLSEWMVQPAAFPEFNSAEKNIYKSIQDVFYNKEIQEKKYEENGDKLFHTEEIYELDKLNNTIKFFRRLVEYKKSTMEVLNQKTDETTELNFECDHQFNPIKIL